VLLWNGELLGRQAVDPHLSLEGGGGRPEGMDQPLLYRDEVLAVVAKPSGLVVHRGWARDPVVAMGLARDAVGRRVYPVHRLDRGTSGVLVFALDPETARHLQQQFEARRIAKRYLALVRGSPPESGVIDHPLAPAKGRERLPAVTEFRRLGVNGRYALVEARPLSGRLHQVRRHLKHVSCPLIGDVRYGKGEHNRWFRQRYGLYRLALHALELSLDHPLTGARHTFRAEVPADLAEPLAASGFDVGSWNRPSR
jgi:tRNA pseudouridine65 synthase